MSDSTTGGKKFSLGMFIIVSVLALFIALIVHFLLKYMYSFRNLDEDTDAKLFYSWRVGSANDYMGKAYEMVKPKTWDTSNKDLEYF